MDFWRFVEWLLTWIAKLPGPKNPTQANVVIDGLAFAGYGALIRYQEFPNYATPTLLLIVVMLFALVCLAVSALL
jgi:hypothetical protein